MRFMTSPHPTSHPFSNVAMFVLLWIAIVGILTVPSSPFPASSLKTATIVFSLLLIVSGVEFSLWLKKHSLTSDVPSAHKFSNTYIVLTRITQTLLITITLWKLPSLLLLAVMLPIWAASAVLTLKSTLVAWRTFPTHSSPPAPHPPLTATLSPSSQSSLLDDTPTVISRPLNYFDLDAESEPIASSEQDVTQKILRRQLEQEGQFIDEIDAELKADFSARLDHLTLHIPISPPMRTIPLVEAEVISADDQCRLTISEIRTYGIRIDLRRPSTSTLDDTSVIISVQIVSVHAQTSAA